MNIALEKKAQHKTVHLHRLLAGLVTSIKDPSNNDEVFRKHFIQCNKLELIELANLNFMSFALYSSLQQKDLLQYLSADEAAYLQDLFELNSQRNREFIQEVNNLILDLHQLDIEVVLLKGAAALVDGWYQEIGERFLRDIDLLVPRDKAETAFEHLVNLGYELVNPLDENLHELKTHQLAALHKKDSALVIELHVEPLTLKANGILTSEQVFEKKIPVNEIHLSKLNVSASEVAPLFIPCPEHMLLIALVHTEIGDNNRKNHRFFLRHGMDVERILNRYGLAYVQAVEQTLKKSGFENLLTDYLQVLDFFFFTQFLQESALAVPNAESIHLNRILDKLIQEHENPQSMSSEKRKRIYFWQQAIQAFSSEKIHMRYGVKSEPVTTFYRLLNLFRLLKKYVSPANRKKLNNAIEESLNTKTLVGEDK